MTSLGDYLIGKRFYSGIWKQDYEILDVYGNNIGQTNMKVRLNSGEERERNIAHHLDNLEVVVEPAETQ